MGNLRGTEPLARTKLILFFFLLKNNRSGDTFRIRVRGMISQHG